MKHAKESRNSSTLFTKWLTIALFGLGAILAGCATTQPIQTLTIHDMIGGPWMGNVNACGEEVGGVTLGVLTGGRGYVSGPQADAMARCLEKRWGWILEHEPGTSSADIRPPK